MIIAQSDVQRFIMQVRSLKQLLVVVLCLCLVCLTTACREGSAAPENIYIADEADNGQTVTMGVGDVLQVMLEENQSTGYSWSVVTNDQEVLQLSDEPAYEVESDAEGAGGEVTWVFDAIGPGTSVLRMVYAVAQETAMEPNATFELTVQVVE